MRLSSEIFLTCVQNKMKTKTSRAQVVAYEGNCIHFLEKKNIQPVIIYGLFERGSKTEVALKTQQRRGGKHHICLGFYIVPPSGLFFHLQGGLSGGAFSKAPSNAFN